MAIRLNKVIRELNIGLQTAVEFLQKKSALGEVEENMNFKINDAQYEALVEEFKSDKETKNKAAKIFPKKPKEKKREPESHRAETLLESNRQQVRPLGKIDLNTTGKQAPKSAEPTVEADKAKPQEKPAETLVTTPPQTISKPTETVAPDKEEQQAPVAPEQKPAVSQETPEEETNTIQGDQHGRG